MSTSDKVSTEPISTLSFVAGENLDDVKFSAEEIADAEAVLAQYMADQFPSEDYTTSSSRYDLYVRPRAIVYLVMRRMAETFRNTQSLKGIEENPELADADVVAAIYSNYLMEADSGTPATGSVEVQVSAQRTYRILENTVMTTEDGLEFVVDSTVVASDSPGTGEIPLLRPDPAKDIWTFYVPVTAAENGTLYNIPANTQLSLPSLPVDVLLAVADQDFTGGADGEGLADIKTKILNSLSARNLVSRASQFSTIHDFYPDLVSVNTQGVGDDLIFRNRNTLTGIPCGGIVDLYVRTSLTPQYITVQKTAEKVSGTDYDYSFTVARDDAPGHYLIRSVRPSGGSYAGTYTVKSETRRINLGDLTSIDTPPNRISEVIEGAYSRWQETDAVIEVDDTEYKNESGDDLLVDVELFYMPDIMGIQELVSDESTRVGGTDTLVRAFVPCLVSLSEIRATVSSSVQVGEGAVRAAIMDYIHSIPPGSGVRVDEIVCAAKGVAGVLTVDLPIKVTGQVHCPDPGGTVSTYTSRSNLDIPTDLDLGIGPENTTFFVTQGSIPVTITEA